ncbi:hypothetical protein [Limnospira maxima]|uniref:hypothetical protein n=1 Tax=Limnospira maxima TaxID=129910 RepID=UPI000301878C|nr:hypothetical protein [Limnospira maxima]
MQQFVSGEELARTIINYCRRSQETRFLSHQWTAEPVPTIINYCRDQETRFLKETGFLSHQWTAEPVPTIINDCRGQETRFLKETGFLSQELRIDWGGAPRPLLIINY